MAAGYTSYTSFNQFLGNWNVSVASCIAGAVKATVVCTGKFSNSLISRKDLPGYRWLSPRRIFALCLLASLLPGLFHSQPANSQTPPQLSELTLTVNDGISTQLRPTDPQLPLVLEFQVSAFDQHGDMFDVTVIPAATASVTGAALRLSQTSLVTGESGEATFAVTVVPPPTQETFTVTVRLTGLPAGQSEPAVEITIIPSSLHLEPLDLSGNGAVSTDELRLIQRWLGTGRPDLTGMVDMITVTADGYSNLTTLYGDGRLDIDGSGTTNEFDIRILIRYQAGLRGDTLGADVTEEQIRQLLGLPLR